MLLEPNTLQLVRGTNTSHTQKNVYFHLLYQTVLKFTFTTAVVLGCKKYIYIFKKMRQANCSERVVVVAFSVK